MEPELVTTVTAAVRLRPMTISEKAAGHSHAVEISPGTKQVIVSGERAFTLNHAFSDESTQEEIFTSLVSPVVNKVTEGFNACVLAYGQTGSGKTYTMGTKVKATTPGVVQKALQAVFQTELDCDIHVSFLEIYREEVLDLLSPEKKKMTVLDFKPVGLTLVKATTVESALRVMEDGLQKRHVGATDGNLHSSRSHAVFTIHFTSKTPDGLRTSKLYLVDLAGSESVSSTSGDTRKEGVSINKGLLHLGIVMTALSSTGNEHIPYRSSTLTSILKDTLSPQNYVVFITCISPLNVDAATTVSSLQFSSRVGSIKANPEAGLIIKQRSATITPFKVPVNTKIRANTTIATPGSSRSVKRPALRPLNQTFDSPRTNRLEGKRQAWPTSTPFHGVAKPLFAEPTPIPKRKTAVKRRSSSEWDPLNVSTSTVLDSVTSQIKEHQGQDKTGHQSSFIPNQENESWLRSLITDVIREELRSHTLLSHTVTQDGPPVASKQLRRSARLSKCGLEQSSFFDHDANATAIGFASKQPRRSARLSKCGLEQSSFFDHDANATAIGFASKQPRKSSFFHHDANATKVALSSPNHERDIVETPKSKESLRKSSMRRSKVHGLVTSSPKETSIITDKTSQVNTSTLRRSARLSVAPRPVYCPEVDVKRTPLRMDAPLSARAMKMSKKAVRLSTKFTLPATSPEDAQKHLNSEVLRLLKCGDAKKLQSLPTIGPKTAVIICNHRMLHGPIEKFKDLESVRGLSTNFLKRFLWANNIILNDEDDDDDDSLVN